MSDYDVLVVGSGAAGLMAALESSESGASVLLVESESSLGGSSAVSGGLVMAAGTSLQRRAGIDDDGERLYREYLLFHHYTVDGALAHRLAHESGPIIDRLEEMGVEFEDELISEEQHSVPRVHVPKTGGTGVVDVMVAALRRQSGVDIALGKRVDRLVMDGQRVSGAAVGDEQVSAHSVVVTTGGFGANPGLWPEYLPSIAAAGPAAWYIGAAGARGDALRFAGQVDADVVGHDRGLLLPTPNFHPGVLDLDYPGWLIIVDRAGSRRMNELGTLAEKQVRARMYGPLFAIFDDAAKVGSVSAKTGGRRPNVNWLGDNLDDSLARGQLVSADRIPDLASHLGIDPMGLAQTVSRYNGFVASGEDREYLKDPTALRTISTPPFYGAELRNGVLCLTAAGLRIDADARVLRRSGAPVDGLFAAGECCGGVIGDAYFSSGNSWADCLAFGRTAGASAARRAATVG